MSDLRSRLRNLRAAARPPIRYTDSEPSPESLPLPSFPESLAPGELQETPHGVSYSVRTVHPPDHVHGENTLTGWLSQSLVGAATFTQDRRLAAVDARRCLFLDTETTGLNAGAGTLVFLVGIGFFTEDSFEVRQYFLRDPSEEPAMLFALRQLMAQYEALVTFNGRSFDVPVLAARYVLSRNRWPAEQLPNLDLLHPARRLWRRRLESCRLASLERAILGVQRTGADVPGFLIPQLYYDYLRTGDARQMHRVMYHNLNDVLSMVTLGTYLCETFTHADARVLPHSDLLSLARWYERLDLVEQAEAAYRAALNTSRHAYDRQICLSDLAALYKRQDRLPEAAALWLELAALMPSSALPRIELAKYHEWTTGDLKQALTWTDSALRAIDLPPHLWNQQATQDEFLKRRERLLHKLRR